MKQPITRLAGHNSLIWPVREDHSRTGLRIVQSWKGHITFSTVFTFVFYRCSSLSSLTLRWVCQQARTTTVHDWFISQLTVHTRQHIFFALRQALQAVQGLFVFFVNGGSLGRWAPTVSSSTLSKLAQKIAEARKSPLTSLTPLRCHFHISQQRQIQSV